MTVKMMVIIVRIAGTFGLMCFAGRLMGLLIYGLSSKNRFWIIVAGFLMFGAGLLLPVP